MQTDFDSHLIQSEEVALVQFAPFCGIAILVLPVSVSQKTLPLDVIDCRDVLFVGDRWAELARTDGAFRKKKSTDCAVQVRLLVNTLFLEKIKVIQKGARIAFNGLDFATEKAINKKNCYIECTAIFCIVFILCLPILTNRKPG